MRVIGGQQTESELNNSKHMKNNSLSIFKDTTGKLIDISSNMTDYILWQQDLKAKLIEIVNYTTPHILQCMIFLILDNCCGLLMC